MTPIFVFGSNLAGRHGAGAARYALEQRGAIYGRGVGLQGDSYGIPTKDWKIETLPLYRIQTHVYDLLDFARARPEFTFSVTRIGCGLAGLQDADIAPMFRGAPRNCQFDSVWEPWLGKEYVYWGTF